jgi:hypothetical protein
MSWHCLAMVGALLVARGAMGQDDSKFKSDLRSFTTKHCIACHGLDEQRAGLRLDSLATSFGSEAELRTWQKVFDRLSKGEMPPIDQPRPPASDLKNITTGLGQRLRDASLARQRAQGRVILRRLNRTEYENTLSDLVANWVPVKDLLPEDNVVAGFDNVSSGLEISPTHLLRYQDAAEKALASVIPKTPPMPVKDRRTGRQITEKVALFKDLMDKVVRLDGDTLILYCRQWNHIPCCTTQVSQAGLYRVKASLYAVGDAPERLPVKISVRDLYGTDELKVVRDVAVGKPVVIEEEFELKPKQVVTLSGWSLPPTRHKPSLGFEPLEQHRGPGLAVEWIEIEGPLDPWPGLGYQRLFRDVPLEPRSVARPGGGTAPTLVPVSRQPQKDADRLIRAFLPRAFRRPVKRELADRFVKVVHDELDRKRTFGEAMLFGYQAVLCSPHFLFLTEPIRSEEKGGPLDDYALAARLSYFLWSTMPDAELNKHANQGDLKDPQVLRQQVERMLKDPQAERFTKNFAGQWLDLRNIDATSPDPQIYGEFDDFLFWTMPRETERFFEHILEQDLSVTTFIDSDWTFLNQRLAQHYGIPGVTGGELRMVSLPKESHRGGVLTQASVLKITADGTRTSPVLRGKWVLDRILGQPPSPPPPDIPSIEPDIRGATTIRQQLDLHRHTEACATCHRHIDPPGFALESFDVIGGWRDFYRGTGSRKKMALPNYPGREVLVGLKVEIGGETSNGQKFRDIDEYKTLLLADRDQIARNIIEKLVIFATGAEIQFADREVVEELLAKSRERNHGFRSMIHDIVQSRLFLNK